MFKVHINDETNELPSDDIYYVVAKEGIFLKKNLGIMESLVPVDKISTLQSVSTYARMNIKKIPSSSFAKVVDFFKKVCAEHSSEAVVLLFYQEDTQKYRIIPPHQKVSAASIEYNRGISLDGWGMVGTIHSHARMSAFHSGIDDDDEETFDGLHITIGNVNDENFSISASIIANGFRSIVDPEEYISGIKKVSEIDRTETQYTSKVYRWKDGKLQLDEKASKKSLTNVNKFDKRYICLTSPSKSICNEKWLTVVEKSISVWTGAKYGRYRYGGYGGYGGYGHHYDPHAWYNKGQLIDPNKTTPNIKQIPLNVVNQMIIDDFKFNNENDVIPCLTCKYRNQKLLLEEDEEFSEELIFKCTQCEGTFTEDDLVEHNMKCPQCKTDEYFTLMDDSEFCSHYQQLSENELYITEQPDQEGFHICKACGTSFLRLAKDVECPYCKTSLSIPIEETLPAKQSSEDILIEQSKAAAKECLENITDNNQDEIVSQTFKKSSTKIPVPGKKQVPLPLQHNSPSAVKRMFRKVFGKGY